MSAPHILTPYPDSQGLARVAPEAFTVELFTVTPSQPANSWRVKLHFDRARFAYVGAEAAEGFKPPVATHGSDGVSFASAGLLCGTGCSAAQLAKATGVVRLLRVTLRPNPSVAAADLAAWLFCFELKSYGGGYLVDKQSGGAYDGTSDTPQLMGGVAVREVRPVGLLSYVASSDGADATPLGVLPNTARLTGATSTFAARTLAVSDWDGDEKSLQALALVPSDGRSRCAVARALKQNSDQASAAGLPSFGLGWLGGGSEEEEVPVGQVLASWKTCSFALGLQQRSGSRRVSVSLERGRGADLLSSDFYFGVWAPSKVEVRLSDERLDRIALPSPLPHVCRGGPAGTNLFQSTRVVALVDGLDVTPLVSLVSSSPLVAAVSAQRYDTVVGLSAGEVWVRLHAGAPPEESAKLVVDTDSPVAVVALRPRLVAGAEWAVTEAPSGSIATATLSPALRAEGAEARVVASVKWSDGAEEEVGSSSAIELSIISISREYRTSYRQLARDLELASYS